MKYPELEVCAGSVASVKAAAEGGAGRVELCAALDEGGVTPSYGTMKRAREVKGININVLIRPRGGDFVYTEDEIRVMEEDIIIARELGMDGVVIGALLPDGKIDINTCHRLIACAGDMNVTFHRAFDMCCDPSSALEDIISMGCDTLLTSGQAGSAFEGIDMLRSLCEQSRGRICIMAGSGVNSGNAAVISSETGCPTLHASARKSVSGRMEYRREGVSMGTPGADEFSIMETSADEVRKIIDSIKLNR